MQLRPSATRRAIAVMDVVLSIAILGFLMALLAPAILNAQATARAVSCQNQLRQWAVGLVAYEGVHRQFPGRGKGPAGSPFVALLPFVDQRPLYDSIDETWEQTSPAFHQFCHRAFPLVHCPAETEPQLGMKGATKSSYCGNSGSGPQTYGFNGLFRIGGASSILIGRTGPVRVADVPDGLSSTAAFSEWRFSAARGVVNPGRLRAVWASPVNYSAPDQLPQFVALCRSVPPDPTQYGWKVSGVLGGNWTSGGPSGVWYNHALTPNQPSCSLPFGIANNYSLKTAGSLHRTGCFVAFADGHVKRFSNDVAPEVWSDLGSRKSSDAIVD